jgi:hypothetical protein
MNKDTVSKLLKLAKAHDALIKAKGYRSDAESDRASAAYQNARNAATAEEIATFEAVYF